MRASPTGHNLTEAALIAQAQLATRPVSPWG